MTRECDSWGHMSLMRVMAETFRALPLPLHAFEWGGCWHGDVGAGGGAAGCSSSAPD